MDEEQNLVTEFDKIAAALAHFQAEVPTVAKTKTAKLGTYSYTYADLAAVTEVAMPILSKHGLAFISVPSNGVLTGMLLHESGQSITGSLPITGGTPQAIGSSLTYMRRYLLGCMTGVVTDDDDDGQLAQAPAARSSSTRTMSRRPQTDGAAVNGEPPSSPPSPAAPSQPPGPEPAMSGSGTGGITPKIQPKQRARLHILVTQLGLSREQKIAGLVAITKRPITSSNELTEAEAEAAIMSLTKKVNALPEPAS